MQIDCMAFFIVLTLNLKIGNKLPVVILLDQKNYFKKVSR